MATPFDVCHVAQGGPLLHSRKAKQSLSCVKVPVYPQSPTRSLNLLPGSPHLHVRMATANCQALDRQWPTCERFDIKERNALVLNAV